jgi:hypothetical protein
VLPDEARAIVAAYFQRLCGDANSILEDC